MNITPFNASLIQPQHVLGLSAEFIIAAHISGLSRPVHKELVEPFRALQKDAQQAGFDLQLASGFRDYQRQLAIWSAKAQGDRLLLDANGQPLDAQHLSAEELLQAIMRWSALPGASRHHWGTDVDVYDAAAVAPDYAVQLTAQEAEGTGPFTALHDWLDERIAQGQSHGFFRPYDKDRGGVSPERWHLSYAPLALVYQRKLEPEQLLQTWQQSRLPLLNEVEKNFDYIWQYYIWIDEALYP